MWRCSTNYFIHFPEPNLAGDTPRESTRDLSPIPKRFVGIGGRVRLSPISPFLFGHYGRLFGFFFRRVDMVEVVEECPH